LGYERASNDRKTMNRFLSTLTSVPLPTTRNADFHLGTPMKGRAAFDLVISHAVRDDLETVLIELATFFRTAIKHLPLESVPPALQDRFKSFPRDMCEFASNLLGRYLTEKCITNVRYVCGTLPGPGGGKHAWLDVQGFTVDITADQFNAADRFKGKLDPVIVTKVSRWHRRLKDVESRDAVDLGDYSKEAREQYDCIYSEVLKSICADPAIEDRRCGPCA